MAVAFLPRWAAILLTLMLISIFLHECAHGFGAWLVGERVSTGFNRVGAYGKRPSDPDFRQNAMIPGRPTISSVVGPAVNWLLAVSFTAILHRVDVPGLPALWVAGAGLSNAWLRLFPMAFFFARALAGNLVLEDEASWGLHTIDSLSWPASYSEFKSLAREDARRILREPGVLIWPALSLMLSLTCVILIHRRLDLLFAPMLSKSARRLMMLMPLLVWPLLFFVSEWLDERVRLNW